VDDIRYIGSTLWSKIYDPKYLVNDKVHIEEFNVHHNNMMYEDNKAYLKKALLQCKQDGKKAVVITHHMPSFTLIDPKYKASLYSQCFASDCDDLIMDPVACWIFGHTHAVTNETIHGIPCIANPIGYPGENSNINFNRNHCIQ